MKKQRFKEAQILKINEQGGQASNLSPEQKLAEFDRRFGEGLGATKERAKLMEAIKLRDRALSETEAVEKSNAARTRRGKSFQIGESGQYVFRTPWGPMKKPRYP